MSLHKTNLNLVSYCDTKIKIPGYVQVKINCSSRIHKLYIIEGNKQSRMGRDWMYWLKLGWNQIFNNNVNSLTDVGNSKFEANIDNLKRTFSNVFDAHIMGKKSRQAELKLKRYSHPVFIKAKTVPLSLTLKIE